METKLEVHTFLIDMLCPKCPDGPPKGYMRPNGTEIGFFLHQCSKCGYQISYSVKYPYLSYEAEDGYGNIRPINPHILQQS